MPTNVRSIVEAQLLPIWTPLWNAISSTVVSAYPFLHIFLIIAMGCFGILLFPAVKARVRGLISHTVGGFILMLGVLQGFIILNVAPEEGGKVEPEGSILIFFAFAIGYLLGEALQMERLLTKLGWFMHDLIWRKNEQKAQADRKGRHGKKATDAPLLSPYLYNANGFIPATLVCAFSASTIQCVLVAFETGDAVTLTVKLITDAALIFALATLYGVSVILSVVPTLIVEGGILLAMTQYTETLPAMLPDQLGIIGAFMLALLGVNMAFDKKIRVTHFIPALIIPPLYEIILAVSEASGT